MSEQGNGKAVGNGAQQSEVVIYDVDGTALEAYGDLEAVGHLVDRLMMLHGAASEVGRAGMRAVASLAIMIGANPLPGAGEIHVWKNKQGQIQVDLGIFFYRRRADELGGIFWQERPRPMTEDERELFRIPDDYLAAICSAVRKPELDEYLGKGFDLRQIFEGLAKQGIGTVHQSARAKEGRPLLWTALKNCEKDLLRQLYSNWQRIPVGGHVPLILQPGATIDQDWAEIPEAVRDEGAEACEAYAKLSASTRAALDHGPLSPAEALARLEANARLMGQPDPSFEGFGDEPEPKPKKEPRIVEGSARIQMPKPGAVAKVADPELEDELEQALHVISQMQEWQVAVVATQQIREASGLWQDGKRDEGKAQPPEHSEAERLGDVIREALLQAGHTAPQIASMLGPQVVKVLFGHGLGALAAQEIQACLERWQVHATSHQPNALGLREIPSLLAEPQWEKPGPEILIDEADGPMPQAPATLPGF